MMDEEAPARGGIHSVWLAIIITVAVFALSVAAIFAYDTAAEAATLLAAVVGPLAGLGAAAFGIKLGTDAQAETKKIKDGLHEVDVELSELRDAGVTRNETDRAAMGILPDAGVDDRLRVLQERLRRLAR